MHVCIGGGDPARLRTGKHRRAYLKDSWISALDNSDGKGYWIWKSYMHKGREPGKQKTVGKQVVTVTVAAV